MRLLYPPHYLNFVTINLNFTEKKGGKSISLWFVNRNKPNDEHEYILSDGNI
jgi:hypothetical protein